MFKSAQNFSVISTRFFIAGLPAACFDVSVLLRPRPLKVGVVGVEHFSHL
jgi:hypothetical protein